MPDYFFDRNRGSDANDGLTPQTAWANLQKINGVAAPPAGTRFMLADDSVWTYSISQARMVVQNGATGTKQNPVVISKYSPSSQALSSQRPTISWYKDIAPGDWAYDGAMNAWCYTDPTHQSGTFSLVRLGDSWAGSTLGTDEVGPLESVVGRYWCSNDASKKLFIYSPGGGAVGTDPTTYYGGVRYSPGNTGFILVVDGQGWVRAEFIHFEDTACGVFGSSWYNADLGCHARGISGRRVSQLIGFTGGNPGQLHALAEECEASDFGPTGIWTYSSGNAGFRSIVIRNNIIDDGCNSYAQGGIYHQARSAGMQALIYGNKVSRCRYGSPNFTDDGCGIYVDSGANDALVTGNTISDCHLALADNSGRRTWFEGNLIVNCKTAIFLSDGINLGTSDHGFVGNTCVVGADVRPTFGPGIGAVGWQSRHYVGQAAARMQVQNNLFVNVGATALAAIRTPPIAPTVSSFTHNAAFGYQAPAALSVAPNTTSSPAGSLLNISALLSGTYRPAKSSPLVGAGTHLGYRRDAAGRQRANPPTIGAFEAA